MRTTITLINDFMKEINSYNSENFNRIDNSNQMLSSLEILYGDWERYYEHQSANKTVQYIIARRISYIINALGNLMAGFQARSEQYKRERINPEIVALHNIDYKERYGPLISKSMKVCYAVAPMCLKFKFGQIRIAKNFQANLSINQQADVGFNDSWVGQSIDCVANQIWEATVCGFRAVVLKGDRLPIQVFYKDDHVVAINNRGLATYAKAASLGHHSQSNISTKMPLRILPRIPTQDELNRLNEMNGTPRQTIEVTDGNNKVSEIITVPEVWSYTPETWRIRLPTA